MKNQPNKSIVLDFWKRAIGERDLSVAEQYISENYIQHSATTNPGKAGIMESLAMLKKIPVPADAPRPFMRVIADDDIVVLHMLISFAGKRMLVVDMTRLHNGQFAEHWDCVQPVPDDADANSLIGGPTEVSDRETTESNKAVVKSMFEKLVARDLSIDDFVDNKIIQHTSGISDGIDAFNQMMRRQPIGTYYRIIAEGNFVVTQSRAVANDVAHAVYDVFRLQDRRIVEQWRVSQRIPASLPHENGMF